MKALRYFRLAALAGLVVGLTLAAAQPRYPLALAFPLPPKFVPEERPLPSFRQVAAPGEISLPPGECQPVRIVTGAEVKEEDVDWGLTQLNVPEAWKVTEGEGVVVAVLDTGVDSRHKDLKNQLKAVKDFTNSRTGTDDRVGHGTHCSGVVFAERNGWGMCGVAPKAKGIVGKVLGDNGTGSVAGIAAGITWAVEQKADVISMSLGGPARDAWMPPALAKAEAEGVIVAAAAGNDGPGANTVGYPGGYRECVAVAATDDRARIAGFSSRGPAVFVSGPGVNVRSCYPGPGDGLFASMSGTSMATPHLAGLAALWIAAHPEVPKKDRPAKFREALKAACKDIPPAGRDTASGWGLPDAAKLVAGGKPGPKQPDPPKKEDPIPPVPPAVDTIVFTPPDALPVLVGGRKVRRIVFELEPIPQPMPPEAKKP